MDSASLAGTGDHQACEDLVQETYVVLVRRGQKSQWSRGDRVDAGENALRLRNDPPLQRAFLWSPDGARVAVTVFGQVLELSADDGSVLAGHPVMEGDVPIETLRPLVWPR